MPRTKTELRLLAIALTLLPALAAPAAAAEERPPDSAEVRLPLPFYDDLVRMARTPRPEERPAPARFALGTARAAVEVGLELRGRIVVELPIDVPEAGWVAIPVLPGGTAVEEATVDGAAVALVALPAGLCYVTDTAGPRRMTLVYRADGLRSEAGVGLAVPMPAASSIMLSATLPGTGLSVSVIPGSGVTVTARDGVTQVAAALPATAGVQLAWRLPGREGAAVDRASWTGTVSEAAATWRAILEAELPDDGPVTLPLLPTSVTLRGVEVDGVPGPILLVEGRHATSVAGRGRHRIAVELEVPVLRDEGPPRVELDVLPTAVARFQLTLPGRREVAVAPAAEVAHEHADGRTTATVFVPLTARVTFRFTEAVPEGERAAAQVNAAITHAVGASEGLLDVTAHVVLDVTRGATRSFALDAPADVQIDRVTSATGAIADWRATSPPGAASQIVEVFLANEVTGEIACDVHYDRSLVQGEAFALPLLGARDVQRQRGMVALLASRELALEPQAPTTTGGAAPAATAGATRVGENQLPADVREALPLPVSHTFKYAGAPASISVVARPPERRQGRFDVLVDTLLSVGEVALKGAALVEVDVKSGTIDALALTLPADATLLALSGPSVRSHAVVADGGGGSRVDVEFTQEMEGRFRLEVSFERVLGEERVAVPHLGVAGATVVQGRLAVEALSAAEVKPVEARHLSPVDVGELPRQLVLRTSNPILLAYRYAHAEPALVLGVTRHRVQGVLEAVIDEAVYRTLFTRDGLAVTTADLLVRNSREQFLRIAMPPGSEVWSLLVDGRAEKPAQGEGSDAALLVSIVNSTRGFPVRLIFATQGPPLGGFWTAAGGGIGTLAATLPRPEQIRVTHTRWDVYLPEGFRYREPASNMDVMLEMPRTGLHELPRELRQNVRAQAVEPLRIEVPAAGKHFAFEKLYANQGKAEAWIEIGYASDAGATLGRLLSAALGALAWGLLAASFLGRRRGSALLGALAAAAALGLGAATDRLPLGPAVGISLLLAAALGVAAVVRRRRRA